MANIVVATISNYGHLSPAMGVASELCRRGHGVWIMAEERHRELIRANGLRFIRDIEDERLKNFSNLPELINYLYDHIIQTHVPFDLMLNDFNLGGAPAFVAQRLGIPWVSFQTGPVHDLIELGSDSVGLRVQSRISRFLTQVTRQYSLPPIDDFRKKQVELLGVSPFLHLIMAYEELSFYWDKYTENTIIVGPCALGAGEGEILNEAHADDSCVHVVGTVD